MPSSVIFTLLVELAFISLTAYLLTRPKKMIQGQTLSVPSFFQWTGMFFLCVTFCWSVVFGIVLAMNDLFFQI
jgi:hypothetical protein